LPETWRRLAGVDEALAALRESRLPASLSFDLLDVPLLSGAGPIEPIRTVDELLDAVAHAVEEIESADELERILDGISRLCDQRPSDFELRAAPIYKRLTSAQPGEANRGLIASPGAVLKLVDAWLTGRPAAPAGYPDERWLPNFRASRHQDERSLSRFISHRLNEIEARVVRRQAVPLLAAPTHRGAWIDPQTLVERLTVWQTAGADPPQADLIQGLLRLAPGKRAAALQAAASLPGNTGRAVRWALGSGEAPTATDLGEFSLWLAAGRARNPAGELVELSPLIGGNLADALLPPTYTCQTQPVSAGPIYRPAGAVDLLVECYPLFAPSPTLQMRPTLALCEPTHFGHHTTVSTWGFQWLAAVWPLNLDPFYADGIRMLLGRVNAPASAFEPNYAFLQPLLEPDRPWTEMAYLTAWIALVSKDADSRGAALDAIIAAIDDGRLDPQLAARMLARLMPSGWVKLNRLADAWREISRVSPLHAWQAADVLQAFLATSSEWPADMHHVLSLLLELLTDLELGLSETARAKLANTKATGKAARAIRRLLDLANMPASSKQQAALQQALNHRLARAERWAGAGPG
jgi:hypothetical protein